jgi:hypothetical protein
MIPEPAKQKGVHPCWVAIAVAAFGILAMLVIDHGPWSRPHVQTAEVARHQTTGQAARSAGAALAPTQPKSRLEPDAQVPKQAEPPNPMPN